MVDVFHATLSKQTEKEKNYNRVCAQNRSGSGQRKPIVSTNARTSPVGDYSMSIFIVGHSETGRSLRGVFEIMKGSAMTGDERDEDLSGLRWRMLIRETVMEIKLFIRITCQSTLFMQALCDH